MIRKTLIFLLLLFPLTLAAQYYVQSQARMYDAGPEAYFPPEQVREIRVIRWVPGARFRSGLDLKVERRTYNRKGELTLWQKFHRLSGELIWEKEIQYEEKGGRKAVITRFSNNPSDIVHNYENKYTEDGKLLSATVTTSDGKIHAKVTYDSDGGIVYVENPMEVGNDRKYTYAPDGRSISWVDLSGNRAQFFRFDTQGELTEIINEIKGAEKSIFYKNYYDQNDRLIMQEESGARGKISTVFTYDHKGRLDMKWKNKNMMSEFRRFDAHGNVRDILLFNDTGYPREVFRLDYDYYQTNK